MLRRPVIGQRPQLALMTFDDRTADGQTDAKAMRFGCVERIEQLFDTMRIQADTAVLNEQFDAVVAIDLRLNAQQSRPVLDAGHCISCMQ
jgi:hypothetical protein